MVEATPANQNLLDVELPEETSDTVVSADQHLDKTDLSSIKGVTLQWNQTNITVNFPCRLEKQKALFCHL